MSNETAGKSAFRLTATIIGALLGMLLILAGIAFLLQMTNTTPPAPADQKTPEQKLAEVQADRQTLDTYGWVDQPNGVVRLPIDQAMRKVIGEPALLTVLPATMPATRRAAVP